MFELVDKNASKYDHEIPHLNTADQKKTYM